MRSGKRKRLTRYFYDDADAPVLSVECDAVGRCEAVSHRRTEGCGQWVYWATLTAKGVVTGSTVDHLRADTLISIWNYDADGQTKREKHFQYAGSKLFKSVSLYYADRKVV